MRVSVPVVLGMMVRDHFEVVDLLLLLMMRMVFAFCGLI